MNPLGLSPDAVAERRKYLCAGDAARIMAGELVAVWAEKTGRAGPEEDLSGKLAVQMGSYSEPFNLWWYERQTGHAVQYFSGNPLMQAIWLALAGRPAEPRELVVSQDYKFMACNLDALSTTPQGHPCVLDAKHVGRADEQAILRYTAAGTHQATVCGTDWWALSFFVGNGKWEAVYQEVDPIYQATLIARERELWECVLADREPVEARVVLAPKPAPSLRTLAVPTDNEEMLTLLVKQNNWLPDALKEVARFVATDGAAKVNAIARDELRRLIPDDVGLLQWGRYKGQRDKAGALRMSVAKLEDEDA